MIKIAEIFGPTIQGEGPNTGLKTLFVRVAGCSFTCSWCDSKFAWNVKNAIEYDSDSLSKELIKRCNQTNTRNIVLTGGNPCLYDFEEVINALHKQDINVDVETQGDLYPKWLSLIDNIVISPKAPSSGQPEVFDKVENFIKNYSIGYRNPITIKIPVFNDADIDFAKKYAKLAVEYSGRSKLYINVGNTNVRERGDISPRILRDYRNLIDKIICDKDFDRVYIMPQVHTLIWGNKQGV